MCTALPSRVMDICSHVSVNLRVDCTVFVTYVNNKLLHGITFVMFIISYIVYFFHHHFHVHYCYTCSEHFMNNIMTTY